MTEPSLDKLIWDYLEDLEIRGRSALTARNYGRYLRTFAGWLASATGKDERDLAPGDVDEERLRQFRLFLARRRDPRSGQIITAATRNLHLIGLRTFLRYCRRRRKILTLPDPDDVLELAKQRDATVKHLEREEALRIAGAIELDAENGLRDRAIVETLFGTGVRVSELVSMTIRQVSWERREAEVMGKGGKARLVVLTDEAAYWIKRYVETRSDDSSWLFISRRRDDDGGFRALTVRQVQRIVDRAAHRAGIPFRVSPHFFRHSRLLLLTRFGGVHLAQRVAGHASLSTTSKYLKVTDEHLKRAFDQAYRAERGE